MMLASMELKKKAVETSSIEAEKQANAEVKQDLHGTKAVPEKIQLEEKEYSPFSMEMLKMCMECNEVETADVSEAYEMKDFAHTCL